MIDKAGGQCSMVLSVLIEGYLGITDFCLSIPVGRRTRHRAGDAPAIESGNSGSPPAAASLQHHRYFVSMPSKTLVVLHRCFDYSVGTQAPALLKAISAPAISHLISKRQHCVWLIS